VSAGETLFNEEEDEGFLRVYVNCRVSYWNAVSNEFIVINAFCYTKYYKVIVEIQDGIPAASEIVFELGITNPSSSVEDFTFYVWIMDGSSALEYATVEMQALDGAEVLDLYRMSVVGSILLRSASEYEFDFRLFSSVTGSVALELNELYRTKELFGSTFTATCKLYESQLNDNAEIQTTNLTVTSCSMDTQIDTHGNYIKVDTETSFKAYTASD